MRYIFVFAINEPHVFINNCTINNCVGTSGGAIEVHADNITPTPPAPDPPIMSAAEKFSGTDSSNSSNWTSGAAVRVTNSTISNCVSYSSGGAMNIGGVAKLDNTKIVNCRASYYGGGISVGEGSTLKMYNSTVTGCTADENGGGGVYVQCGVGGGMRIVPGHAEIWGGSITGNKAPKGAGVYFSRNHGGSTLKIGGELVVKENIDTSGKQSNIEMDDNTMSFYDEGLYGKADVRVGSSATNSETKIGKAKSQEVAEKTASHITPDHLNVISNRDGKEEEIGIYTKPNDSGVYLGPSRKMELVDVQLKDRPNVKAEINRETKEITFRFPFSEGLGAEGAWPEPIRVIWASGHGGTCYVGSGPGQPGTTYSGLNKYTDSIVTTFKKASTAQYCN